MAPLRFALGVALASSALVAGCGPERFLAVDTGTDADLRGLYAQDVDRFWIAGAGGTLLRWDGEDFVRTSTDADPGPRRPALLDVSGVGREVVTVGEQGLVLRVEGAELVAERSRASERLQVVLRAGPRVLFAGGEGGRVIRRERGEAEWTRVNVGAGRARITGGWSVSEASTVLTTDQGAVIERVGDDWVSQTVVTETSSVPLPLFGVWSATVGADLVAVGLGGNIYRRPAGEPTWVDEDSGVTQDLYAVYGTAEDDVFAVGAAGTILHYDGAGWRGVPSSTSQDLFAVGGLPSGEVVVAVGRRGAMVVLRRD